MNRLIRLLTNDRCLVVAENEGDLYVYVGNANSLDSAISGKRHTKSIKREKTGQDVSLSFDEDKRTLAICGVDARKVGRGFVIGLHLFTPIL